MRAAEDAENIPAALTTTPLITEGNAMAETDSSCAGSRNKGYGVRGGVETRICIICGEGFQVYRSVKKQICSRKCDGKRAAALYASRRVNRKCEHCGKPFVVRPGLVEQRYCGFNCRQIAVSRITASKRSEAARARATAKPSTYRKLHGKHEHRHVAELKIGRALLPGEIVHHKDENKHNNAPDNLEVLPSQSEHARLHSTKNRVCVVPGCGRRHAGKGYCQKHWRQWRNGKLK